VLANAERDSSIQELLKMPMVMPQSKLGSRDFLNGSLFSAMIRGASAIKEQGKAM